MENYILGAVLIAIVVGIIRFIYRAKKQGQACIGCPHSKQCSGHCGSCCEDSCSCEDNISEN